MEKLPMDVYSEIILQTLSQATNIEELRQEIKHLTLVNKEFQQILSNEHLLTRLFHALVPEKYRLKDPKKSLRENFFQSFIQYTFLTAATYMIVDNGGYPYMVKVFSPSKVCIYRELQEEEVDDEDLRKRQDEERYDVKRPLCLLTRRIWIGKSPETKITHFSTGYGPQWDGNSILVELKSGLYVYVGSEIYSFVPLAPIVKFVSPIGNSFVPYPWAQDANGNYYMLWDKTIVKMRVKDGEDPLDVYLLSRNLSKIKIKYTMIQERQMDFEAHPFTTTLLS